MRKFNSDITIEGVGYQQFSSLIGESVLQDDDNAGCSWYLSSDRRVAARLVLNSKSEKWNFDIYHWAGGEWGYSGSPAFEKLEQAEQAMLAAIREQLSCGIHFIPVPMRLRFGRRSKQHFNEAAEAGESPLERRQ